MSSAQEPTYTAGEVMALTGCTYRQLGYWSNRGYVEFVARGTGSGHRRLYSPAAVERVRDLVLRSAKLRSGGLLAVDP